MTYQVFSPILLESVWTVHAAFGFDFSPQSVFGAHGLQKKTSNKLGNASKNIYFIHLDAFPYFSRCISLFLDSFPISLNAFPYF